MHRPRFSSMTCLTLSLLLMVTGGVRADALTAEQTKFFEQKIRPVLVEHCYECHSAGAKKIKGGLVLDTRQGWEKGGDSGEPSVVRGDPEKSLLLRSVRHEKEDLSMPPKKPKLSDAIIADLASWVQMGAHDPREGVATEAKRADKTWWSLQPLAKGEPPSPAGLPEAWRQNPIDRFIFAKMAEKGLQPSAEADRRTLIRRLSYDLTGLPPTVEEVEAFVKDANPLAYERLVDRLLDSPHHGEQWGRHWLDVVRFGESNGFERNVIIDNAWPFRDYVINSINEDKPFNRFIIEHLAGDVIGKNKPEVEVASAFLTVGPYDNVGNKDVVAQANIRAATLDDMVTATGSAFLGLTINCARCHHHKFDPIPTEDYYRLKAAFEGVTHGDRVIATEDARKQHAATVAPLEKRRDELTRQRAAIDKAIVERGKTLPAIKERPAANARLIEETFAPVEASQVRLILEGSSSSPISAAGAKLEEVEVWTSAAEPENVALAKHGTKAEGAASRTARDFATAYGVSMVNDGKFGEHWIIGSPSVLTLKLPKAETINRVTVSHNRMGTGDEALTAGGAFVCEFQVQVSADGVTWRTVADTHDRKALSPAMADERLRRRATSAEERAELARLDDELATVNGQLGKVAPLPAIWAGNFKQFNQPTVVHRGGDPMKPGDPVLPSSLNVLEKVTKPYALDAKAPEGARRLALGEWIVSDENPLTARVLVNRVWHYHFGTGIVDTPGDFGFLGSKPTHPELLDWLARRLHQHGWRLKALHRDIVLSQAYRQSSAIREDAARIDRDARLIWRFPTRRLSAEEIRDTLLAVSGQLDLKLGGPGFRLYDSKQDNVATYTPLEQHGPETYRRAVYHQNVRASVVDLLSDFDLPDNAFAVPRRSSTTTPLQALTLLNHSFTLDMARALSARIVKSAGNDDARAQTVTAYRLLFQHEPSVKELDAAQRLITAHGLQAFCRALLNANELLYLQ